MDGEEFLRRRFREEGAASPETGACGSASDALDDNRADFRLPRHGGAGMKRGAQARQQLGSPPKRKRE
ncbi:hypothetical protein G5B40_00420 [Pikeienuella piscinae]|uniref:Uncharacterized protein n=1 Tax=Pikeienuella piscinae TaxID=2748098 RepID=A0A7L5BUH3_9RHOB|nr:hypothetical protein [Pikeienuella piscinae]QIE54037.1 hypothetical protein G5B40_00420 [Pikeienuella piscinae]